MLRLYAGFLTSFRNIFFLPTQRNVGFMKMRFVFLIYNIVKKNKYKSQKN